MPYVGPGSTTTTTTASPISPVRSLSLPNPHSPEPSTSTSPSTSSSSLPTSRESSNTAEEDASHPTSPGMLSPLGLTALSPPMSFRQFAGFAQQEKQDQPQTSSPQETQHQQPQPQPQQPAGRPGHRRSYSHTHITAPSSYKPSSPDSYTGPSFNFSLSSNSSRNGLGSLPTRRSRTGSGAHSRSGSDVGPSVSQGGGAQQHKFHIGGSYRNREGGQSLSSEEDDSSDEKSPPPPSLPPTPSRMKGRAKEDDDSEVDREERDKMLRLPPLKLRVRTGSAWDEPPVQRRVGTPPLLVPVQPQAATANAVPFPTTKSPSPVGSATVLPLPVLEVVPSKANEADASSNNTNSNGLRPPLAAPQMRRATSESSGLPTSASLAVAATSAASGPPVIVLTEAPQPQPSSSAQTQAQAQVASPPPSTPTYAQTYPNRPTPSRTASSPILLLSNGKPLRSSLKSSSSSPNIPFPSQSLVPSMLWPDLHRDRHARYSTTGYEGDSTTTNSGAGQGHQRTASAPSTPNIGGSSVPPPSLTSSVSSIASSLGPGPGDSTTSTPTSSAHTTPASSPPLSPHMQYHPHPPKNVHFPSQDNNLATVKIFNKGARPAAVSLSRTGSNGGAGVDGQRAGDAEERGTGTEGESQTETETEGEAAGPYGGGYGGYGGFGAGLLGRWGRNAWGAVGGSSSSGVFGYGTYVGGGSRSVPAVSSSGDSNGTGASGYPFPKVHPQQHSGKPSQVGRMQAQVQGADSESEVDSGREGGGKEKEKEKEKGEWYFDLDAAGSSCVPMIGAERGEGNGNVYLESVGFVRGVKDFGSSTSSSSSDRPARPLTLTGTLLVRNVTYAKTVAVRFTLDEWHTTNDVLATHERSLAGLPGSFFRRSPNGDLRLSETTKVCSPYDIEHGFPPPEGQAPAWDRFRFYINMEDYALSSEMMKDEERLSSNPLEKRTMWLVGRYDAGVDLAMQLDSQATGAGVGGTGAGGEGGLGSHSRSGSIEHLPTNLVPGQEWWDNNGGANYKIVFRRVKVPVPATGPRARREGGLQMPGMYRRISAPTAYSPPPVLAPPQISQSISLPISANQNLSPEERERQAQRQKEQKEALAQSTLARLRRLNLRNYAAPGSSSATQPTTPPATSTATSDSSAAKGGLPAAASRGGIPMGTPRKDSTSSVDSTPVHTPVVSPTGTSGTLGLSLGHPSNDLKSAAGEAGGATHEMIDDDITPRVDGVGRPSWGSSTPTSATEIAVPKSTRMAVPMSTAGEEGAYGSGAMGVGGSMGMGMSPSDVVLGSSPPFSFSSMLGSRPTIEKANEGGYWPWSSFSGSSSTTAAPDKGNSLSNGGVGGEAKKAKASEATTTTNPNANATSKGPAAQAHTRIPSSSDVAAAFGSPSPRTGMVGLPHRRARKDSGGGALKLAPPPAVAPRARANGNDDRDSDSSSASVSSAGAGGQYPQVQGQSSEQRQASAPMPAPAQKSMNMGAGPTLWGLRSASPRPGSPRPGSPRPPASSGTRSPLRVSPVNSSSNLVGMGNGGVKSPLGMAMNMGMEMNSPGTPVYDVGPSVPVPVLGSSSAQAQAQETKSGSSTTSDAIYQAFVRQWCFAQAPGPSVGTTAAGASSVNARGAPGRDEAGVGERDFGVIV